VLQISRIALSFTVQVSADTETNETSLIDTVSLDIECRNNNPTRASIFR
jgi:hypothetical protein